MPKLVPEAKLECIIRANQMAHERPDLDGVKVVGVALEGIATPDEMTSVLTRMVALRAFLMANQDLRPWLLSSNADLAIIDEAILKATARSPLREKEKIAQHVFDDDEFKKILLEESRAEGSA